MTKDYKDDILHLNTQGRTREREIERERKREWERVRDHIQRSKSHTVIKTLNHVKNIF